nr:DUF1972 domain-containing protein [uncultured Holophaga sp.]
MNSTPPKSDIAILGTRGIPARYGGFETFAEELSTRLASAGVKVTVFCESRKTQDQILYKNVTLQFIPLLACGPLTTILFDLRCFWAARRNFKVVYMLGYGAAFGCLIPRFYGTHVWLNVDGIEWKRAKWSRLAKLYFRAMEYLAVRLPHRVIADAESIRQHLLSRHRAIPPCDVIAYGSEVIAPPPPPTAVQELGLAPGRYFLIVCRLEPENHILEIVKGYIDSGSTLPLVILGNHKAPSSYVKKLTAFESDKIRFLGTIFEKKKLQPLRAHALAYFHGHSVGGTNPTLLEAMGCGSIVIAHDNAFNREVLSDTGFYFKSPDDIPELINTIEHQSFEEQNIIKATAVHRVREHYQWDNIASKYLALLQ